LLIGRDTFFILDFLFDVFDSIAGFGFDSDSTSCKGSDENL
jgi:hypothetical protein